MIMKNRKTAIKEDLQFPNFVLPATLPDPIKEVVNTFCKDAQELKEKDYEMYKVCAKHIKKVLPVFTAESSQKIWKDLVEFPEQSIQSNIEHHVDVATRAQKIAQLLLYMENLINIPFDFINHHDAHVEKQKKSLKETQDLMLHLIEFEKSLLNLPSAQQTYCSFLEILRLQEKILSTQIKILEGQMHDSAMAANASWRTEFAPITRKSNNAGKPTIYACFLCAAFERLYGKPKHSCITNFINIIFAKNSPYTVDSIRAMVLKKDIKRLRTKEVMPDFSYGGSTIIHTQFETFLRRSPLQNEFAMCKVRTK